MGASLPACQLARMSTRTRRRGRVTYTTIDRERPTVDTTTTPSSTMSDSRDTTRPTHIDLPVDNHDAHDEPHQLQPSGERPPPARGILKNARPNPATGADPSKEQ